jgi:catalase
MQSVLWDEAVKISGADPDFHRRDLREAIERDDFPEWELGVQLFDEKFAETFAFDILDATKLIPEEEVPVKLIGRLVLDRNVENFFLETEQVAFCTTHVIPGMQLIHYLFLLTFLFVFFITSFIHLFLYLVLFTYYLYLFILW